MPGATLTTKWHWRVWFSTQSFQLCVVADMATARAIEHERWLAENAQRIMDIAALVLAGVVGGLRPGSAVHLPVRLQLTTGIGLSCLMVAA